MGVVSDDKVTFYTTALSTVQDGEWAQESRWKVSMTFTRMEEMVNKMENGFQRHLGSTQNSAGRTWVRNRCSGCKRSRRTLKNA